MSEPVPIHPPSAAAVPVRSRARSQPREQVPPRARAPLAPALAGMVALTLTGIAILAPAASADGLPLPFDASASGVLSEDGRMRYLTAAGDGRTAVIAQRPGTGAITRTVMLRGSYTVPLVAYDGTASGLAADERTLVVIRPRDRFPRRRTVLAVLDTRPRNPTSMRVRRVVSLDGDFSFDALSPDGRWLYLIHYIDRRDATRYRVRAYDIRRGRLAPKPITDPREAADEMNGLPRSRATSPDGRWAYTLYDSNGPHPFIHALDTRDRRAVCIDLDDVADTGVDRMTLEVDPDGATMTVAGPGGPVAAVDTQTFVVSDSPTAGAAADQGARESEQSSGIPWAPLAALAGVGGSAALALRKRSRRVV